jgi:carboxylate-amine ligase
VEEELMLLNPRDHALAQSSDRVLAELSDELRACVSLETHAAVLELATGIHADVTAAVAELAWLRAKLTHELGRKELRPASAGTYPLAVLDAIKVSRAARYGVIAETMRSLARRHPTMALHVHVGVPSPDEAICLLNAFREIVPVLLALAANSPFCDGQDTGFASARTAIFQGFPRTGTARRFDSYGEYSAAVDPLIDSGALPGPTFLWWDVRLQPALGTVEIRVMDSQTTVAESAPLIALIQSFAHLVLERGWDDRGLSPEVLAENRFLAARDGLDALLIDPEERRLVPVRVLAEAVAGRCRPHAAALGCADELDGLERLSRTNGADRQRARARAGGLTHVVSTLAARFA